MAMGVCVRPKPITDHVEPSGSMATASTSALAVAGIPYRVPVTNWKWSGAGILPSAW